jgi:hypothetical protein
VFARQEVLNTELARLLCQQGLIALPEQRLKQGVMPDLLLPFRGFYLVIEAEVDDQPQASEQAWCKAVERVEQGLAHLALALVYPASLRELPFSQLGDALRATQLRFSLCAPPIPDAPDWRTGDLNALTTTLQHAYQSLASEDEVRAAVEHLKQGVNLLAEAIYAMQVPDARLAEPLGIDARAVDPNQTEQTTAVRQIAALVLLNAMLFHEELTRVDPRVRTLHACLNTGSMHDALLQQWKRILDEIDYHAVFALARGLLENLPPDRLLDDALGRCVPIVRALIRQRVMLRHDLAGRIYHLLLGDIAKPLGTFYTAVPSATLLLRLALAPDRWHINWEDPAAVGRLRLADLACGTGTLLMAAVQAIVDNYMRSATPPRPEHRKQLLKDLLEEGIYGLDVLQSAVHLTASTLALPIPEVMARGMRLYTMPLGFMRENGREVPRFGSLDLLSDAPVAPNLSLFPELGGQTAERATDPQRQPEPLRLPPLDLVCMNPPFTRTCGDNLLFGSLPKPERTRMQKAFQEWCKRNGVEASITAGLGAVFITAADRCLKPDGRLAFVLPKALLSGVEWRASRELLSKHYTLEYLIVSHDPTRWHFSENTDLSETLFVARKASDGGGTLCLNLWRNPDNPVDALLLAEEARKLAPAGDAIQTFDLWLGDTKWGEAHYLPDGLFKQLPHWMLPCAFAQGDLNHALLQLLTEHRYHDTTLTLAPIRVLGELGPDRRDIYDGFEILRSNSTPTSYPALWGHEADKVFKLQHMPNAYLTPLHQPRKGRPLRDAGQLWNHAGTILLAERMRLNTQRLVALHMDQPVLANVWWSFKLQDTLTDDHAKSLVLWLNSTLGLLLLFGNRQETEGAWVSFKKPLWQELPVLDVKKLPKKVLKQLAQVFDMLCQQALLPLPQMASDAVRAQIDAAIANALGLPDLTPLREQLAREPVICLQPLRQRRRRSV